MVRMLQNGLLVLLVLLAAPAYSHTDLDLQIAELSQQLNQQTDNVDLLLRRGDLQRRHENRELALADFSRVREIQPGNALVDWFEGRLQVETGQPQAGVRLLDRFLLVNPNHAIALQNRAQGYLLLDQPLAAAQDFKTVIRISKRPTPSLFNAAVLALVKAGADHYSDAMDMVMEGLQQFPAEVTLTGIGTDISLARHDIESAIRLMDQIPAPIQKLYQWQFRRALLDCQSGKVDIAMQWFANAGKTQTNPRNKNSTLKDERFTKLLAEPSASNCHAAAEAVLKN